MLYKAYGLCIYSDFNLPFLDIASKFKTPEVSLEIDQSLVAPLEYKCTNYFTKTSQDSVVYIRKGIGLFFVKKDSIKIKPDCASLDEDFARVLLGLPFGYLLMLRSQLTFHASAVSKNNKGVIFIGKSGIGKSTIAYELLLKGFKFIAEDICSTSKLKLINSFPMLKLSDDHFTKEIDFFKKIGLVFQQIALIERVLF